MSPTDNANESNVAAPTATEASTSPAAAPDNTPPASGEPASEIVQSPKSESGTPAAPEVAPPADSQEPAPADAPEQAAPPPLVSSAAQAVSDPAVPSSEATQPVAVPGEPTEIEPPPPVQPRAPGPVAPSESPESAGRCTDADVHQAVNRALKSVADYVAQNPQAGLYGTLEALVHAHNTAAQRSAYESSLQGIVQEVGRTLGQFGYHAPVYAPGKDTH